MCWTFPSRDSSRSLTITRWRSRDELFFLRLQEHLILELRLNGVLNFLRFQAGNVLTVKPSEATPLEYVNEMII